MLIQSLALSFSFAFAPLVDLGCLPHPERVWEFLIKLNLFHCLSNWKRTKQFACHSTFIFYSPRFRLLSLWCSHSRKRINSCVHTYSFCVFVCFVSCWTCFHSARERFIRNKQRFIACHIFKSCWNSECASERSIIEWYTIFQHEKKRQQQQHITKTRRQTKEIHV